MKNIEDKLIRIQEIIYKYFLFLMFLSLFSTIIISQFSEKLLNVFTIVMVIVICITYAIINFVKSEYESVIIDIYVNI